MQQRFYMDISDFDAVKTFRKIKENISKDIWGLSYEELIRYLQNRKAKFAANRQ